MLGALPLRALDEDRISAFRAALHGRLAASTANVVLSKLGKMLRFARKLSQDNGAPRPLLAAGGRGRAGRGAARAR